MEAITPEAMKRLWEVDALRGLMLVLMTLTHLPSRLTDPLGQPFGFVSAAEGFVLLSAFMAGPGLQPRRLPRRAWTRCAAPSGAVRCGSTWRRRPRCCSCSPSSPRSACASTSRPSRI
jgi:hypothetical protein